MLVITTSVVMLDGIALSRTSGQQVTFHFVLVVAGTSVQDWLVHVSRRVTPQAIARHVDISVLPRLVIKRTRVLRSFITSLARHA